MRAEPTRTSVCTAIVGVNTDEPHPAGISAKSRTTTAFLHPFMRVTIVGNCDSKSLISLSVWMWKNTTWIGRQSIDESLFGGLTLDVGQTVNLSQPCTAVDSESTLHHIFKLAEGELRSPNDMGAV